MGLLPGACSAHLVEGLARLGARMPFEQAAEHLAFFWGVQLSEPTVRRAVLAAGAAWVQVQTAEVEQLEREPAEGPPGPPVQQVSADGAMVPLVGGEWAEAKTVVVGTVQTTTGPDGTPEVHTVDRSYFSRLADAQTFTRLALVELHQRGTETAGTVVAPMDGAEWEQAFLDTHRPDAVRILDFPHAVEHLAKAAQATFGPGTAQTSEWLGKHAHTLKHGDPEQVLAALRALPTAQAADPVAAAETRDGTLHYLEKRRQQIQYAHFQSLGYPIGSGSVESANKLVVEARLKGSGMHWARDNVNPMLALRTIACGNCWNQAWPQIEAASRAKTRQRSAARRLARRPAPTPVSAPAPTERVTAPALLRPADLNLGRPPTIVNGRPTRDHPWNKYPVLAGGRGRAKR